MATARRSTNENNHRDLLQKYRIFQDLNERQAPGHEDCFDDIRELGSYTVDKYRSPVTADSRNRPWRQTDTVLRRVRAISAKAHRCSLAEKNEPSWRLSLESEILSRFDIEVVCPKCRARLWRAELEVAVTASNESLEALARRQQRRKACTCSSRVLGDDRSDSGLNPLFDDRADEPFDHDEEIEKALKRSRGKKPDRIVGLRATERIKRILTEAKTVNGKPVGEFIKVSPLKSSSTPLLFPFLILEAKSEKSPAAFSKIYLQTAFAIRALLDLQRNLVKSSMENEQSGMQPLVWFLANRGEDWRVHGAYLEEKDDNSGPNYRILELWTGNIRHENDALRLVLIIDYIFDWARDVYRRDIISSLLSLAAHSTPSIAADTDVYSTADPFFTVNQAQDFITDVAADQNPNFTVRHLLQFFNGEEFALRDARYMHRRLCGLYITRDNLRKLLSIAKDTREVKQISRRIWRSFAGGATWSVSAACLNAVEELWTGKSREHETFQNPEQRFLAIFFIRSYLSQGLVFNPNNPVFRRPTEWPGRWDQHHELTYVAVAEDALDMLREKTEFAPRILRLKHEAHPRVSLEWVVKAIEAHRFAPTLRCFLRAVFECTFQSTSKRGVGGDNSFPAHEASRFRGASACFEPSIDLPVPLGSQGCSTLEIPWLIYDRIKVGMSKPNESFLRISHTFGKHELAGRNTAFSPLPKEPAIDMEGANTVIVREGRDLYGGRALPRQCIFILEELDAHSEAGKQTEPLRLLSHTLCTPFDGRSHDVNRLTKPIRKDSDLQSPIEFLDHVSMKYQLIHSLHSETALTELPDEVKLRCETLISRVKAKWHFNTFETLEGIKAVGAAYNFGQVLQDLSTAFKTVRDACLANHIAFESLNVDSEGNNEQLDATTLSHANRSSTGRNRALASSGLADGQGDSDSETPPSNSDCALTSSTLSNSSRKCIDLTHRSTRNKRPASSSSRRSGEDNAAAAKKQRFG